MIENLRKLVGDPMYRPLVQHIAKLGAITERDAPISDEQGRIDTNELIRQRAARDFAWKLLDDFGWTLELRPPAKEAPVRQAESLSE